MASNSSLVIPIVLWGKEAPTHSIKSMAVKKDLTSIVTGCYDGHICIWDVEGENMEAMPRCFLIGHSGPITALAYVHLPGEKFDLIVSASENGELCNWDAIDGRCLESTRIPSAHTYMHCYTPAFTPSPHLFCTGYYPDVQIVNPITLELVITLSSHVTPDWVSTLHVLRPNKKLDDVILALTVNGTVKVWTINEPEFKSREPLYENESKQIRIRTATCLICCKYNNRTVLIVSGQHWQIYDAGDFSVLTEMPPPKGERWLGGQFLSTDRVICWTSSGKSYLFRLPNHCIVENKEFHKTPKNKDEISFMYCSLGTSLKPLVSPPSMHFASYNNRKILMRGDSEGRITTWTIPDMTNNQLAMLKQEEFPKPPEMPSVSSSSLQSAWDMIQPSPPGILDQFDTDECRGPALTCSIYLAQQSRLVCGREDGSIVVVPATHTVMLHLLHGRHQQYEDWPLHQLLLGHKGRVNCLVYPHGNHPRYDSAYLVSGGRDFSIILWDIVKCDLLHRFCVQAGEITQILIPPNECSPRLQHTICSVASDHSAALLSLREKKSVLLASRHLFPISCIKWRPLDDFLIVGCADGTVYIWQMETGNLDRVLHGMPAEDVLSACDENALQSSEVGLVNPAVHFFRGLKSKNLAAIRHAAQRGLHHLQGPQSNYPIDPLDHARTRLPPLIVQGLRTNESDSESHVLFFDIEALIVQLLTDEYGALSPNTLEGQGLIGQSEFCKVLALTHSSSPDAQKKIADFFGRVKDKAGEMERSLKDKDKHGLLAKVKEGAEKIQAKAETALLVKQERESASRRNSTASLSLVDGMSATRKNRSMLFESTIPMEIAQLLLSLLLGWGLDNELDQISESRLGLLKPLVPVTFGMLSRSGYMSLMSPTWRPPAVARVTTKSIDTSRDGIEKLSERVKTFTSQLHWEISHSLTTNHLLTIVALANTLMSMQNATFIPEQERLRRANRPSTRQSQSGPSTSDDAYISQQAASKHGWSLIATLHCVMLHEKIGALSAQNFKEPLVETLAVRWQDRCVEIRDAAQALLLAELSRIGAEGRKKLVEAWASYIPNQDPYAQALNPTHPVSTPTTGANNVATPTGSNHHAQNSSNASSPPNREEEEEEEEEEHEPSLKPSPSEYKRKQATAIILLGVLGAEFGEELTGGGKEAKKGVEGFSIGNSNLARLTSKSLTYLLLNPAGGKNYSSLRRAAIDLIGRGFTVWEPFLDVSKVLLALLELCCEADHLVPSMAFGLPLTPSADACRTARHALTLIATARPPAFITTMAREVARYNTLQQNAQAIQINLATNILNRSKPEILRIIELLIEKMQSEITDLIVEVMDIVLHCVDHGHLKTRPLSDVFPALCRFSQVSHCGATRRIAVGSKAGNLAIYELRSNKSQSIAAHSSPITGCAFSPDGKYLASFTATENKMSFWQQSSSGMFGLGQAQTRCVKTITTIPLADAVLRNTLRPPRLVWTGSRNVSLLLADGSENRYGV